MPKLQLDMVETALAIRLRKGEATTTILVGLYADEARVVKVYTVECLLGSKTVANSETAISLANQAAGLLQEFGWSLDLVQNAQNQLAE